MTEWTIRHKTGKRGCMAIRMRWLGLGQFLRPVNNMASFTLGRIAQSCQFKTQATKSQVTTSRLTSSMTKTCHTTADDVTG